MAEYKWKFVLLGDPDVTVNQSRGINMQFNGYVPLNCPKNAKYLSDLISQKKKVDISTATSNGNLILMFRDVKYKADNAANVSLNDSNYQNYLKKPGVHMFQGLTAMASDEIQIADENGQQRSTLTVEIPLYDTMFGDRLTGGKARIDGVLLYGQAYNPMFNDEHRQGDLEKAVPIALILFAPSGTGDKPQINPSGSSKVNTILRVAINMLSGDSANAEIVDSQAFKDWSKLAGTMHIVNEGIATSADFIVRGHEIDIAPISDDFAVSGDRTIDVASRFFFSEDPEGTNTDLNVDFGSPARLNVMNYDEVSEGKKPQMMISKVKNWTDTNGYKHASWDGVVESWYSEKKDYPGTPSFYYPKSVSGSLFDVDYVALGRPGISIFSEDVQPYVLDNTTELMGGYAYYSPDHPSTESEYNSLTSPGMHERCDKALIFADGYSVFSKKTKIANETLALSSEDVESRGKNVIIGSAHVGISTKDDYDSINRDRIYKTFIANSQDVQICDQEEVPDAWYITSNGNTGWGAHPYSQRTFSHTTVLSSESIQVFNWGESFDYNTTNTNPLPNPYCRQARNFVAASRYLDLVLSDTTTILGLKGAFVPDGQEQQGDRKYQKIYGDLSQVMTGGPSDYNGSNNSYRTDRSTIWRSQDSIFLNGQVHARETKGVVVIGTGYPHSRQYGANIVEGFRHFEIPSNPPSGAPSNWSIQNSTTIGYHVEHSAILGIDNRISCIVPERASKGAVKGHWCKGSVSNVYEIGRTLINDVRQQHWIEEQYETVAWLKQEKTTERNGEIAQWDPTTIILGNENAYYVQKGKWIKQIVVGGFRGGKGLKGANKSWGYLPYWKYNSFEFKTEWNGPSRNALAIQDLKGRQVLYTSQGINLGFIKGARNDISYEGYQYSDMGNINLFKLYRLLRHLRYDYETGYVRFDMTDESTQPESNYPAKFCNQGKDYQGNPSTCLADLVDDRFCYYPNFPIGDPYSDGGGTYTTPAVGGGDCTNWTSSSSSSSSGGGGGNTPTPTTDPTITGNLSFTYNNASYSVQTRVFNNVHITNMITVNMVSDLIPNRDDTARSSRSAFHTPVYYTSGSIALLNSALSSTGWRVAKLSDMQSLIYALTGQTISQSNRNISGDLKALYRSDWLQNSVPDPWVRQLDGYLPKDKTLYGEAIDLSNYCYVWCFDDNSNRMAIKFNGTSASLLVGDTEIPTGVAYYIALAKAQ